MISKVKGVISAAVNISIEMANIMIVFKQFFQTLLPPHFVLQVERFSKYCTKNAFISWCYATSKSQDAQLFSNPHGIRVRYRATMTDSKCAHTTLVQDIAKFTVIHASYRCLAM